VSGAARSTGYVSSGGERIYYEVVGEGTGVVFCHGLGGNHASWFQQVPRFAPSHRVVTWDQRGFGNSTRSTGNFGPAPAVDDLVVVLDTLGLERVHVVGQSMGGWVALGTALHHGGRLRSLVLSDTPAGVQTPEIGHALAAAAERVRDGWPPAGIGAHPALSDGFVASNPDAAYLYQELSSFGHKADEREMFARMGDVRVDPAELDALSVPVLLVVGEEDRLCPPAAVTELARLIAGAELVVVAGAGHSPYFETPGAFNDVVLSFVDRVDAGG